MACKSKQCGKSAALTTEQKTILNTLAAKQTPCGTKEIAAEAAMESKEVSAKLKTLKEKGYIDSPVRCKYAITPTGKSALTKS